MGFLDAVKAFFTNYLLVSAIVAWITAQIFKIFTGVYKDRRINLTLLLFSTAGACAGAYPPIFPLLGQGRTLYKRRGSMVKYYS